LLISLTCDQCPSINDVPIKESERKFLWKRK